jgi:hypothetical protein
MATAKKTTETKPLTIHQKISKISEEMGFLSFDKKNTGQGYEYASSSGAIRKLQLLLIKYKMIRYVVHREFQFIPGADMKGNMVNTEALWAWVCTESGDSIQTKSCGQGKDSSDKGMGKSQTNDNKYDIAHTLCLAWGAIDPDSDPYKEPAAKKAPVDPKKVAAAIKAAKTVDELDKSVKPSVLKLSGADKKAAVKAYTERKAELSA